MQVIPAFSNLLFLFGGAFIKNAIFKGLLIIFN